MGIVRSTDAVASDSSSHSTATAGRRCLTRHVCPQPVAQVSPLARCNALAHFTSTTGIILVLRADTYTKGLLVLCLQWGRAARRCKHVRVHVDASTCGCRRRRLQWRLEAAVNASMASQYLRHSMLQRVFAGHTAKLLHACYHCKPPAAALLRVPLPPTVVCCSTEPATSALRLRTPHLAARVPRPPSQAQEPVVHEL